MNLLQVPVLFYVVCFTMFLAQGVTESFVDLAWGYVALRVLHSLVHLTYNKVKHRLLLFAASNVVVVVMWVQAIAHCRAPCSRSPRERVRMSCVGQPRRAPNTPCAGLSHGFRPATRADPTGG